MAAHSKGIKAAEGEALLKKYASYVRDLEITSQESYHRLAEMREARETS